MSEHEPTEPRPVPQSTPPPSGGPAGWPGSAPFGQGAGEPAPPPKPPEVVEAVPLSRSQARGPAIEVEAERIVSEPPPAYKPPEPPRSESVPPPNPPAGGQATATAYAGSRVWAVLAHLAYLIPLHVPGLIVTLLIWICTRRENALADDQARESLNFQITYALLGAALTLSCFLTVFYFPVWMIGAILSIMAAVHAGDGLKYRYPYILRLIK